MFTRRNDGLRAAWIDAVRAELGYTPRPDGSTVYGEAARYVGPPWNGMLVDYCARKGGLELPSCASTTGGLAQLLADGRQVLRPETGDLVFYAFSADGGVGQPHVGVVTDVSRWGTDGTFRAIEGAVPSGLPRSNGGVGVYERTRHGTDVLAFCRPAYTERTPETARPDASGLPLVTVAHLTTPRRNRATELFQDALAACAGLRTRDRGAYCSRTRSATARFQRTHGRLGADASGLPDDFTVRRLAQVSGLFRVD